MEGSKGVYNAKESRWFFLVDFTRLRIIFMMLIFLFLFLYTVTPLFGFFLAYFDYYNYPFYDVTFQDLVNRGMFFLIFWIGVLIFYRKASEHHQTSFGLPEYPRRKIISLLFFLAVNVCFVFIMTGYDFVFEGVGRGDLRTSHGLWGPVYRLSIGFLIPILSSFIAIWYFSKNQKKVSFEILIYFFLIFIGIFSTGYKGSAIYMLGPFFVVLLMNKSSILRFSLVAILFFSLFLLTTSLVRGINIYDALKFLTYRVFYMTTYGDVAFLSVFNSDNSFGIDFNYLVLNFFGNKIYWLFYSSDGVLKMLASNLSTYTSLLVYPDYDSVILGKTNVTVTNFSESIFLFGRFFFIYPLFFGFYVGLLLNIMRRSFCKGKFLCFSLVSVYFLSVVLPWVNSGSFLSLFSFYTVVFMILTWVLISFLIKIRV